MRKLVLWSLPTVAFFFFNWYYALRTQNTWAIFLLCSVSYLNRTCFLRGTSTIETQHPSVKSAIQSVAELLFNSYAENPPLLQTDIARGENRYSRKISSGGSGFCRAIAIYRSHTVLGSQKDERANSVLSVNAWSQTNQFKLEVKASRKGLGFFFFSIDLAQVNVLASQRDFKFISRLEFHLFGVGGSNQ